MLADQKAERHQELCKWRRHKLGVVIAGKHYNQYTCRTESYNLQIEFVQE